MTPVMRAHLTGHAWWHWVVGALVVAALVVGTIVSAGGLAGGILALGIRTSKTVGYIETAYYLDGNKIIAEERRDTRLEQDNVIDALYYHYGLDGITGFEYRKTGEQPKIYIYRKNIQGDITHIFTSDGECIVKYIYDACY